MKLILIAVFFVGIAGLGFCFLLSPQINAYSSIRDPGGIPQGLPVRLKIPVIGVDAAIEDALLTPDGRMDVPAGASNVAWYALGPQPGQVGSAVIGGHYGVNHNVPFVFYKLNQVKIGDKAYIVDDKGNTLAFQVRAIQSFDRTADATTVFTSTDGLAHLNIITCEGVWNQVSGNYPLRLVVFTDEIPSEGAAPAGVATAVAPVIVAPAVTPVNTTFNRILSIGSKGADVVALQTFLEQRGLLELPPGVTNGFFGALTREAVIKYQASAGLPLAGVFGPLTRARVISDLGDNPAIPDAGIEETVIPIKSPSYLIDTLITLFLLLSIIFIIFKMVYNK